MKLRGIDFTGIAYLAALGIAGLVGWRIYQAIHDAQPGEVLDKAAGAVKEAAVAVVDAVTPTNPENIVNRAATAVVQTATGNKVDSIGTGFYNMFHPDEWLMQQSTTQPQKVASFNFWDSGEPPSEAFTPPGFIGKVPLDPVQAAIVYRAPKRLQ